MSVIDSISEAAGADMNLKRTRRALPLETLPPHSIENEAGILGCVLIAPADSLPVLAEARLEETHFYDLRHQVIFHHCKALHDANVGVDILTLQSRLKDANMLDEIGGITYLLSLQDAVPSAANLPTYIAIVREKFMLRALLRVCADISARAMDGKAEADLLMDAVEQDVVKLCESRAPCSSVSVKDIIVNEVIPELEEHYTRGKTNLPPGHLSTGFDYFDKVSGGFGPQDYVVLAGRPGGGKTALAMNIAEHHALAGLPVGIFSLEMSRKSLARRLMFKGARVSMGKFRQGFASKSDFEALSNSASRLSQCPMHIDAEPSQSIGQIEAKARAMVRQHGIKLFVLDYLQLVLPNERRGRIDRVQELTDISARFVALKKRLKVPWLILAQMNRNIETAESHRVPVLSDLKDCGAIEQDADQVLFIYFPERGRVRKGDNGDVKKDLRVMEEEFLDDKFADVEHTEKPVRVNLFQAKHREGATGPIEMLFHKNQSRFEDWRQWSTANGFEPYGKGERPNANPLEQRTMIDPEDVP